MIKNFFIASLIFAALSINNFHELHAAKGRRTIEQARALAQVEWTEADIVKKRDTAFTQKVNALSKNPEALRNYLSQNKLKRYPGWINDAQQKSYYNSIESALQKAITKSPNTTIAHDLAQAFTTLIENLDSNTVKRLNLDAAAEKLANIAQPAGGGVVAPPIQPAVEIQAKEELGIKRLQIISEIQVLLENPIGFKNAFTNTDTLSLEDFMKQLSNFLTNKFDEKAQKRLSNFSKKVESFHNVFTFEMEANFLFLRHLEKDWQSFYKQFSKKSSIKTYNDANFLKNRLTKIINEISKKPLISLLKANTSSSYKSSGVYNTLLHDIWYQSQPSSLESSKDYFSGIVKPKSNADQVKEIFKNFNFADIEKAFHDTQSARNMIDKLSKQTFWQNNPQLAVKIKQENNYNELESLEEKFNKIKTTFETDFEGGKINPNYSKKTKEDAENFIEQAQNLIKIFEPWTDITKNKAGILVGAMRATKAQTREEAITKTAEELKTLFMNEKINFDSAFGDANTTIDDFIKSIKNFITNFNDDIQIKFTDEQKVIFTLLKRFSSDFDVGISQKTVTSETELAELRFNTEAFKEKLQDKTSDLSKILQAEDLNKEKPQHRNTLLSKLWIAKVLTDIDETLLWKIDFNNAFGNKDKLTIPEFMEKLHTYLNKFDKDAKTRMEKGWYQSWMPKIYDGLQTLYHVDWIKDFKNKFDKKEEIKTLTDAENLWEQLNAIKKAITDNLFEGVNIFRNNMEGVSIGWTNNGNLNNMSNYAFPMTRWLTNWFTGTSNMPTEAEEATQANEILKTINLDEVKKQLIQIIPIKEEIDTLVARATAADEKRASKAKAAYSYAELNDLKTLFNSLKTEAEGDTITTRVLANDFKNRVEQLSKAISEWATITNEKPAQLKAALEAVPVIAQKITQIEALLKTPIGYDSAFGTTAMTIAKFMKALKIFVDQFTEEDKNYLSESSKKNLAALQKRCTIYDNFLNKFNSINETDTVQKVTNLVTTIQSLVTEITKVDGVFKKHYAKIDHENEAEIHNRNSILKTIWTEIMVGRKVSDFEKTLDSNPCAFSNPFGEDSDPLAIIMGNLKKFLDDFNDNDRKSLKDDRKINFEQLQNFYDTTWLQEIKTPLDSHKNNSSRIKTVAAVETLETKIKSLKTKIENQNDDIGKLFYLDAPSKKKVHNRNQLLSAIWTEAAIATQVAKINEVLNTPIDFDTHFGKANNFTVKTCMDKLGEFLNQFDDIKKQRLATTQASFSLVPENKENKKLKAELRVKDNLDSLIKFYENWVSVVKTQGEGGYKPSEIKDLKTANTLLDGFTKIKEQITENKKGSIRKLIEGPVNENQYLKNIETQSKPSAVETIATNIADKGFFEGLAGGLNQLNQQAEEKRKQELTKKINDIDELLNKKISYNNAFGPANTVSLQDLMNKLSDFLIKFKDIEKEKLTTKNNEFKQKKYKNNKRPQETKLLENFNTLVKANNEWDKIFKSYPNEKYDPSVIKTLEEANQLFTTIEKFYYSKITPEQKSIRPLLENVIWNDVQKKNLSCLHWIAHFGTVSLSEPQPLTESVQPSPPQGSSLFSALRQQIVAAPSQRSMQAGVDSLNKE